MLFWMYIFMSRMNFKNWLRKFNFVKEELLRERFKATVESKSNLIITMITYKFEEGFNIIYMIIIIRMP